jgi:DNA gyrase subunit A
MNKSNKINLEEEIVPIDIEEEMKSSYLDYAMSTIVGRALPDIRDGLKPVHRRILVAMKETGNFYNKPYKKSARIVGEVMGKYHPHGNQAIYDALVRMAQVFSMRYPLIDGQGNFGSVDGDSAAAMRYTEARMAKISNELLADIDEETVNFQPNYDNTLEEPLYLPSKLPNLIINGATGIAVGMTTNIPPHNLGEIIDGILYLIKNPNAEIKDLMKIIHGPDFPTAGLIIGSEGIKSMYLTGRGIIKMRARIHFEPGQKGVRDKIIVTELPYQVNKARLIEHIAHLAQIGKVSEIADIRDESDRVGMRISIDLKRGENSDILINKLYKHTRLQTTFGAIMLALKNGRPKLFNLLEFLLSYIEHRRQIIIRRTKYRLRKAQERAHILEGLKIALENIDLVVSIIRSSKNTLIAKQALSKKLLLTEIQTQAILDMRLARLTSLEQSKIIDELNELKKHIVDLKGILDKPERVLEIIAEELKKIRDEFSDDRRTEIVYYDAEIGIEDIIADDEMVISVSRGGYIKRTPMSAYRSQRRGGKGITAMKTKEEDFVSNLFVGSGHDTMLFFTKRGKAYSLKLYEIAEVGRYTKGTAIINLLKLDRKDSIASIISMRDFEEDRDIFFVSKKGYVKRTALCAFSNVRRTGIKAIAVQENDKLICCEIVNENQNIFLATKLGKSITFSAKDVRRMGRNARGVRGIRLRPEDEIVAMVGITNPDSAILFASENGYGKRTFSKDFRIQKRGGLGIISMKVTPKTGYVIGAIEVNKDDGFVLVNSSGVLIRIAVSEVSIIGRSTQGVKLIALKSDQTLADIAKVVEKEH